MVYFPLTIENINSYIYNTYLTLFCIFLGGERSCLAALVLFATIPRVLIANIFILVITAHIISCNLPHISPKINIIHDITKFLANQGTSGKERELGAVIAAVN